MWQDEKWQHLDVMISGIPYYSLSCDSNKHWSWLVVNVYYLSSFASTNQLIQTGGLHLSKVNVVLRYGQEEAESVPIVVKLHFIEAQM